MHRAARLVTQWLRATRAAAHLVEWLQQFPQEAQPDVLAL